MEVSGKLIELHPIENLITFVEFNGRSMGNAVTNPVSGRKLGERRIIIHYRVWTS